MNESSTRVRRYTGFSPEAAAAEYRIDAARAAAAGYVVTSMAWQGVHLIVTYQLQPQQPPATDMSSAPAAPTAATAATRGSRPLVAAAAAVGLVILGLFGYGAIRQHDANTPVPPAATAHGTPAPGTLGTRAALRAWGAANHVLVCSDDCSYETPFVQADGPDDALTHVMLGMTTAQLAIGHAFAERYAPALGPDWELVIAHTFNAREDKRTETHHLDDRLVTVMYSIPLRLLTLAVQSP